MRRLGSLWSSLRGILLDNFSFSEIKKLCANAGLPIEELAHLQQKPGSYVTKGRLLDNIDKLVADLDKAERDRFVAACVEEIVEQNPKTKEVLEKVLSRVGWCIIDKTPFPSNLSIDAGLSDLPDEVKKALETALKRYRDGDTSGALTSICGMVDRITEVAFSLDPNLGPYKDKSYHEKISKSFSILHTSYIRALSQAKIDDQEIQKIWHNQAKSVSQSGYVLGFIRREFADVHGWKSAPRKLVQVALDNATYIIRMFFGPTSDLWNASSSESNQEDWI